MRFYAIALFLFVLNLSFAMINDLGVLGYRYQAEAWTLPHQPSSWQTASEEEAVGAFQVNPSMVFGDFIRGLSMFLSAMAKATIFLPALLYSIGLPSSIATAFWMLCWFVYIVAGIQFLSGRKVE